MGADMNVIVRTHYAKDDPGCHGDYHSVDVVAADGAGNWHVLKSYGDHYHDKGRERVEGFLDALRFLGRLNHLSLEQVADSDL